MTDLQKALAQIAAEANSALMESISNTYTTYVFDVIKDRVNLIRNLADSASEIINREDPK